MVGFNLSYANTNVHDYASAVRYWEGTKPWRGETDEHDPRPLKHQRSRDKSVCKTRDGAIRFKYHRHDVVSYLPDGTIELEPYSSKTTDWFASWFLDSVSTYFTCGVVKTSQGLWYLHRLQDVSITPDGEVVGADDWVRFLVDAKAARAIRKEYRIPDIRAWLTAGIAVGRTVTNTDWHSRPSTRTMREWCADPAAWPQFYECGGASAVDLLDVDLIRTHALTTSVPRRTLKNWCEVKSYRASWQRYGRP